MTSDAGRRLDHNANAHILGLASLPVFAASIGGLVLLAEGRPIGAGVLFVLALAGYVKLLQYAGRLGRETARKHRGQNR